MPGGVRGENREELPYSIVHCFDGKTFGWKPETLHYTQCDTLSLVPLLCYVALILHL